MKTTVSFIIGMSLIFSLLLQSGCEMVPKKGFFSKDEALLEPSMNRKITDIPIPARFKFLPQNSYFFENAGIRVGVLKYIGKANPDSLVNFFKEQMLMNNWRLINIIEYNNSLLNFERNDETCIINLAPKGGSTIITVSLGPKSQETMVSDKDKNKTKKKEPLK